MNLFQLRTGSNAYLSMSQHERYTLITEIRTARAQPIKRERKQPVKPKKKLFDVRDMSPEQAQKMLAMLGKG